MPLILKWFGAAVGLLVLLCFSSPAGRLVQKLDHVVSLNPVK
jgi:hypothetical protein